MQGQCNNIVQSVSQSVSQSGSLCKIVFSIIFTVGFNNNSREESYIQPFFLFHFFAFHNELSWKTKVKDQRSTQPFVEFYF